MPTGPSLRAALMLALGGLILLAVSLAAFGLVAAGVRAHEVFALDTWATTTLHGVAGPGLDALMQAATTLGSNLVIWPLFLVSAAWLGKLGRYGSLAFLSATGLGALVLQGTMKIAFERARPQLDWVQLLSDYSFPSGHTMNALVFYTALALVIWSAAGRRAGVAALVGAMLISILVGVSRIYLGYHYLTDVVGGLAAGLAWLLVVGAAFGAGPLWRLGHGATGSGPERPSGPPRA